MQDARDMMCCRLIEKRVMCALYPMGRHRSAVKELAKESLVEDTSLITETMARIYAAQGQLGRARRAYKLLALKYPEKSVYFAAQSKQLGRKSTDDR